MVEPREGEPHVQYTWEQFDSDVERIARAVEGSGRTFTHVHGLTRGGLALAVCLSHRLNLDFAIEEPSMMSPTKPRFVSAKLHEVEPGVWTQRICAPENLLVVDDLSDTGKQLKAYRDAGLFIATIHKKPWTQLIPDIWIREETRYVDYPWEKKPR